VWVVQLTINGGMMSALTDMVAVTYGLIEAISKSDMSESDKKLCRWLASAIYRVSIKDYTSASRHIGHASKEIENGNSNI
jgi:hypothetical protein